MANLKTQVEESADELRNAWTGLQSPPTPSLPQECYARWIEKAKLHIVLDRTAKLFPAREMAWLSVSKVAAPENTVDNPGRIPERDNLVRHRDLEVDFPIARHLELTAYVTITWAIYDRLTNVCGRLAASDDIAQNPKNNPKACELFVDTKKPPFGFDFTHHIKNSYGWPLKSSYKVRNWLVHEGFEEGNVSLFAGDKITDGFRIHEDAAKLIQESCGYTENMGQISFTRLSATDECWQNRDLLTILEKYHAEVDRMFVTATKWCVSSFVSQIRSLTQS